MRLPRGTEMMSIAKQALAAALVVTLAGCGGTNSPLLGTGASPRIRALNLLGESVTAVYDNAANPIGTVASNQVSNYQSEGEGNNTVIFDVGTTPLTSLNTVFQYGNYYTVVAYSNNGQSGTFKVTDNNIALDNGLSQLRCVNADTTASGNVDVYVQAGVTNSPSLVPANLISSNSGIAFGAATAYASETPGQYTLTVTPAGNTGTVLLSTTATLNGGQSLSVYCLTGSASVTTTDDEGG